MLREYICPQCGKFDDYRKDTEIPTECPTCENEVKQSLGLNFKLIGPGFYSNDYEGK